MKYFLYTAQTPIKGGFTSSSGTMSCEDVFFTPEQFNDEVNFKSDMPADKKWNIIFLKELTKEEYEYYNK